MKLAISHALGAAPDRVYAALIDPAVLRRCIDGCEKMEKAGEDGFDVQVRIGLAAMKGVYAGKVRITERRPPESLTLAIEGKGLPGFVRATARIRLVAKGNQTELTGEGEANVGGVIAAVGSRLIEAAAKKLISDFFAKLDGEVTSPRAS